MFYIKVFGIITWFTRQHKRNWQKLLEKFDEEHEFEDSELDSLLSVREKQPRDAVCRQPPL